MCVNQRFFPRKLPDATNQIPLVRSQGNEAVSVHTVPVFHFYDCLPSRAQPCGRQRTHPASVPAGVPAAQLGRAEEIVSREHLVCVEKWLFSQAVSTHTAPPRPGSQRLVLSSAQDEQSAPERPSIEGPAARSAPGPARGGGRRRGQARGCRGPAPAALPLRGGRGRCGGRGAPEAAPLRAAAPARPQQKRKRRRAGSGRRSRWVRRGGRAAERAAGRTDGRGLQGTRAARARPDSGRCGLAAAPGAERCSPRRGCRRGSRAASCPAPRSPAAASTALGARRRVGPGCRGGRPALGQGAVGPGRAGLRAPELKPALLCWARPARGSRRVGAWPQGLCPAIAQRREPGQRALGAVLPRVISWTRALFFPLWNRDTQ